MSGHLTLGVVDIGNSGIKMSMADVASGGLIGQAHLLYWLPQEGIGKQPPPEFVSEGQSWISIADVDRLAEEIIRLRQANGPVRSAIAWRVSSVQPAALETFCQALHRSSDDSYRVIGYRDVPMEYRVALPEKVGIDRLLAAWYAWQSSAKAGPLIVIQAGTAVTVDWVDEAGAFCGGAIMPGMSLTLKYLAAGTAHLPWLAPPSDPTQTVLPGSDTRQAILAGVTAGFIGGIRMLQQRYREQYHGDPHSIQTVVSGGDRSVLARSITPPFRSIEHLVLKALACLPDSTSASS